MYPTRASHIPTRSRHLLTAAAAALLTTSSAHAASRYWANNTAPFGNANWSSTANWSATPTGAGGASVPSTADTAYINFNDPKNQTTLNPTLDITSTIAALNIGSTATGVPTLFQNTNTTLTVSGAETLGYQANGRAAYTQSAGTNIPTGLLSIADAAGSRATYNLSDSATLRPGADTYLGNHGAATFNQTGGTFSTNHSLFLAYDTGSSATYNLQAGSLSTGPETIGYNSSSTGSASASFLQSGGTHSPSSLYLGYNAGSSGYYSLSDPAASLSVFSMTIVGDNNSGAGTSSSGSFSQSAGSFSTASLTVGSATAGGSTSGTFTQSAGSLSAASLIVGSATPGSSVTALFSLGPAASLTVTGAATIGYNANATSSTNANATFLQTGGSFSTQNLNVGYSNAGTAGGAIGLYSLSSGSLSVSDTTTVGNSLDPDTFSQTGGTHTNASLTVNANSTYLLAGPSASLTTTSFANVYGTFSHTAGTYAVGTTGLTGMAIAGTYSLSGSGALINNGLQILSPGGTYAQSAGASTVGSPINPARVILGFDEDDTPGFATYSLSGTASSTVYGPFDIGGSDLFPGITGGPGTLSISGGTLTIHGPIHLFPPTLGGSNSIHIDGGSLSLTSIIGTAASIDISHGTLSLSSPDPVTLGSSAALPITLGPGGNISAASFVLTAGDPIILNGGSLNYSSSLSLAGATLVTSSVLNNSALLSGSGTISGPGGIANSGSLSIPSGILTLSTTGSNSSSGLLSLSPGAQLSLTGSSLSNTGLLTLSPGSRITGAATLSNSPGGVIQGAGTISSPLSNSPGATLLVQTGTLNLSQPLTNAGTIQLAGPASTLAGSPLSNTGTLRGDGTVTNPLSNSGEIRADSSQSLTLSNMPSPNTGTLNLQGGSLIFSLPLTNSASITSRGGSLSSPSLTNTGSILLTAGSTDFHAPLTSSPGSSITLTAAANATFFSPVTLQPGSQFHLAPNSTASFLSSVTGQTQFTGPGLKDFESGASSPSSLDTAGLGATAVQSPSSLSTSYLNESSLTLSGPLTLTPNSPSSTLTSLRINPTGSLNLSNNTLTITSISPDTLRNYLFTHQLFSSSSSSTQSLAYYPTDSRDPTGPWSLSLSLIGDLNLDGKLTPDDYALLDRSFAKHLPDPHWTDGDLNYDGLINQSDYLLLDTTYAQSHPLTPDFLAQRESQFGDLYVQHLLTNLPEPSLLAACGLRSPLLTRRRQKSL